MPAEFRCDGCNKIGEHRVMTDEISSNPVWALPIGWLDTLNNPDVNAKDVQIACSRECAERVSEMSGLKMVILNPEEEKHG